MYMIIPVLFPFSLIPFNIVNILLPLLLLVKGYVKMYVYSKYRQCYLIG